MSWRVRRESNREAQLLPAGSASVPAFGQRPPATTVGASPAHHPDSGWAHPAGAVAGTYPLWVPIWLMGILLAMWAVWDACGKCLWLPSLPMAPCRTVCLPERLGPEAVAGALVRDMLVQAFLDTDASVRGSRVPWVLCWQVRPGAWVSSQERQASPVLCWL